MCCELSIVVLATKPMPELLEFCMAMAASLAGTAEQKSMEVGRPAGDCSLSRLRRSGCFSTLDQRFDLKFERYAKIQTVRKASPNTMPRAGVRQNQTN